MRAFGVYFDSWQRTPAGLPGHLRSQYTADSIVINYDNGNYYNIWEYYKHSSFHIRFRAINIPVGSWIEIYLKVRGPDWDYLDTVLPGYTGERKSIVEIFVGSKLEDTREFDVKGVYLNADFEPPKNPNYVDIFVRPVTNNALALIGVFGFILESET